MSTRVDSDTGADVTGVRVPRFVLPDVGDEPIRHPRKATR